VLSGQLGWVKSNKSFESKEMVTYIEAKAFSDPGDDGDQLCGMGKMLDCG